MVGLCRHCDGKECYLHCQETDDGNHEVKPGSAITVDGYAGERVIVIDVWCKHCGQSGAGSIAYDDIQWV